MNKAPIVLALALLLGACELSEGDRCQGGGECVGANEALLCIGGQIRRTACRGAAACTMEGDEVRCDRTLAQVGDPCAAGNACSPDRRSFLVCRDGRFALGARCPSGCLVVGDRVVCPHPDLEPELE
jgi:hypothetical protein